MGLFDKKNRYHTFEPHDLQLRRYECVSNYPEPKYGKHYKLGEIHQCLIHPRAVGEDAFYDSPNIFKELDWFEKRSFDEIFSIKWLQMIGTQYFIPGDILEVDGFKVDDTGKRPIFIGFKVGVHTIKPTDCVPLKW